MAWNPQFSGLTTSLGLLQGNSQALDLSFEARQSLKTQLSFGQAGTGHLGRFALTLRPARRGAS